MLRILVGSTAVALTVSTLGGLVPTAAAPDTTARTAAPGAPGHKATWTESNKTGFGTARTRGSNVWFTLQRGRTSEVFYPNLSTPSVRSLELVVTGPGFTDRESSDMRHRTTRPDPRSLRFRQVDTDRQGRYRVVETFVTDPRRDAVDVAIRFTSLDGGRYRVYALYDPSLDNTGMDDHGRTAGHTLVASDQHVSSALVARPAFGATSTGYLGTSDGWTDLKKDQRLDHTYRHAGPGNVVQGRRITGLTGRAGPPAARPGPGFGRSAATARRTAQAARSTAFGTTQRRYDAGWHAWVRSLKRVPASAVGVRRQYLASALVVAAAEDKRHPGAFIASPSAPLGVGRRGQGPVLAVGRLPPGLVARRLPVRHRALGDGRQGGRTPDRALAVHHSAEARRLVPAELRRHREAGLDRPPARRGRAADRAGPPGRK